MKVDILVVNVEIEVKRADVDVRGLTSVVEVVIVGVVVDEVSGPANVEKSRVKMIKYKNKFLNYIIISCVLWLLSLKMTYSYHSRLSAHYLASKAKP